MDRIFVDGQLELFLALCEELPLGGSCYGSDSMVVCNDWHSALVPMLIHAEKTTTGGSFLCHA